MTFTNDELQAMNQSKSNKPKGFTPKAKADRLDAQMTTKCDLCSILNVSVEEFEAHCKKSSLVIEDSYTQAQVGYYRDRLGAKARATEQPAAASNAIPTARTSALTLSGQSHEAMNALQGAGLQNAAAYVQRKQTERNAVVDKVSDAIAYLSDPDLLESDIMTAAAAKVAARSDAWGYSEPVVDFDNLFALPTSSQRMLNGV